MKNKKRTLKIRLFELESGKKSGQVEALSPYIAFIAKSGFSTLFSQGISFIREVNFLYYFYLTSLKNQTQ
jgi:hypothetical protein